MPPPARSTTGRTARARRKQQAPGSAATALPAGAFVVLVLVIVGLVLFGGWVAFGFAVALMVLGVFALTRFVQRLMRTPSSELDAGLSGMHRDLSITPEAHEDLSPHDIPLDSPAHRELEHRLRRSPGE